MSSFLDLPFVRLLFNVLSIVKSYVTLDNMSTMERRSISAILRSREGQSPAYKPLQNEYSPEGSWPQRIFMTMYNTDAPFIAAGVNRLAFTKNEKLVILEEIDSQWWLAYRLADTAKKSGLVSCNYVRPYSLHLEDWFFGRISRHTAERVLKHSRCPNGTFLVRNCEQAHAGYSLSILHFDPVNYNRVKHYRIQRNAKGRYYITLTKTFRMLYELVDFYTAAPNGLCHQLTRVCPRTAVDDNLLLAQQGQHHESRLDPWNRAQSTSRHRPGGSLVNLGGHTSFPEPEIPLITF